MRGSRRGAFPIGGNLGLRSSLFEIFLPTNFPTDNSVGFGVGKLIGINRCENLRTIFVGGFCRSLLQAIFPCNDGLG